MLGVQANMPFQIMIPAYLPGEFDRAGVDLRSIRAGPSGEPMVQLAYHTPQGAMLFVREWVPGNPEKEILANSRPIETKWGKGWLLSESDTLAALWVCWPNSSVGLYSKCRRAAAREGAGHCRKPGTGINRQVFTFVVDQPTIKDVPPAPPVEIP